MQRTSRCAAQLADLEQKKLPPSTISGSLLTPEQMVQAMALFPVPAHPVSQKICQSLRRRSSTDRSTGRWFCSSVHDNRYPRSYLAFTDPLFRA